MDLNYKYSIKRWFFNYPIPTFLSGWDLVQQRLSPMRVTVGFDMQCAARTFLLVDRNVARNPAQDLASVVMGKFKQRHYRQR